MQYFRKTEKKEDMQPRLANKARPLKPLPLQPTQDLPSSRQDLQPKTRASSRSRENPRSQSEASILPGVSTRSRENPRSQSQASILPGPSHLSCVADRGHSRRPRSGEVSHEPIRAQHSTRTESIEPFDRV
ncbi:uncharacterized protein LOC143038740 [Oratosquilla oratoria]|uniref:uncharacterized protein LOC143038740 n=1 Tax=Oratosquilla oratoria TaxID=337810 RepID=UPI003F759A72